MHHKRFMTWLKKLWQNRRTALLFGFVIALVLVALSVYLINNFVTSRVVNRTGLVDVPTLKLDSFEAELSGLKVDALDASRPVTGVIIENSPSARPQSGLDDAEVVFEAIAEGGITRFVVFYQVRQPSKIGPVRSVRPHFNDWIRSFDASIAHAGGSAQGLAEIKKFGIKDLDQFANAAYYYRDSSRFAPHNLYTSMSQLDAASRKKGFDSSDFNGWEYEDGEPSKTISADKVSAVVSSGLFNISYKYSAKANRYLRSVGGSKHIDANTNKQISVDNVIIMEVPYEIRSIYYHYDLVGTGKAHLFRNGRYLKITWSRSSRGAAFKWLRKGEEIKLNRGQTWVTAISPGNSVKVTAAPEASD